MKLILVAAGHNYYPSRGEGDFLKCFETISEAQEYIDRAKSDAEGRRHEYYFKDRDVSAEWAEIIDLCYWVYED